MSRNVTDWLRKGIDSYLFKKEENRIVRINPDVLSGYTRPIGGVMFVNFHIFLYQRVRLASMHNKITFIRGVMTKRNA